MNRRTLTALQRSIKKWEKIVAGTGTDHGSDNCALCQEFYDRSRCLSCLKCPVYESTGNEFCRETPYFKWMECVWDQQFRLDGMRACTEEQFQAAQDELEFLRSLLPQEDQ